MKRSKRNITAFTLAAIMAMGGTAFAATTPSPDGVTSATVAPNSAASIAGTVTSATTQTAEQAEIDKLTKELLDVTIKENRLDLEEDQLELSYKKGEISADVFKARKAQIEKEDQILDTKEDELDRQLSAYGIDVDDDDQDNDKDDPTDNDKDDAVDDDKDDPADDDKDDHDDQQDADHDEGQDHDGDHDDLIED
ncbi:MAG: hypothetical protein RR361_03365 [Anaerovorax sp.]